MRKRNAAHYARVDAHVAGTREEAARASAEQRRPRRRFVFPSSARSFVRSFVPFVRARDVCVNAAREYNVKEHTSERRTVAGHGELSGLSGHGELVIYERHTPVKLATKTPSEVDDKTSHARGLRRLATRPE